MEGDWGIPLGNGIFIGILVIFEHFSVVQGPTKGFVRKGLIGIDLLYSQKWTSYKMPGKRLKTRSVGRGQPLWET